LSGVRERIGVMVASVLKDLRPETPPLSPVQERFLKAPPALQNAVLERAASLREEGLSLAEATAQAAAEILPPTRFLRPARPPL
jgi:hypothetical protein